MNLKQELNLQLFADAGTLVNASGNYVNAYSGETNAFPEGGGMTASMSSIKPTPSAKPPAAGRKRTARTHSYAVCPQAGAACRPRQDRGMAQVEHA